MPSKLIEKSVSWSQPCRSTQKRLWPKKIRANDHFCDHVALGFYGCPFFTSYSGGVYQIGDVYALSCVKVGTS